MRTGPRRDSYSTYSEKSTFGKRLAHFIAHDQVVQHADIDQRQGLLETSRDQFIGLARLGDAGRVVVSQCDVRSR